MSLLLDALKKAEKAKDEAQRRAKGADAVEPAPDPEATVAAGSRHVMTRDDLPEISEEPLEILDMQAPPAARAPTGGLSLALEPEPAPAAEPDPRPEPRVTPRREPPRATAPETQSAERATAHKVFEAKFKEPNPRLPFYITVGVLGAFAVGTVVYFWLQLRPPAPLVNTNPGRPAAEAQVAAAPANAPPQAAAVAPAAPTQIPGLPGSPVATSPVPAAATTPATAPEAKPAAAVPAAAAAAPAAEPRPAAKPRPRALAVPAGAEAERSLSVSRPTPPQVHPRVQAGYAAYHAGDLAAARREYTDALRDEPASRDALLGLAAVEMRAQNYDGADALYRRLLQANPRDAHAQAGMLALRSQLVDPVQAESRLKNLLAGDPDAGVLHFSLGNQYAQQSRWAEAQQAYFKAYAAEPDNPDFAFNLAVSLDQLRQAPLALEYYRRALTLAEKRAAGFNAEAARGRVQQLSR